MASNYYAKLTLQLRRKGIDDARILSTLNDVKGWISAHPDQYPEEHFGPPAALARDMPRGNAVHAPQKILAYSIAVGLLLLVAQIVFGFFNVNIGLFGLPASLIGLIVIVAGAVASRFVGGKIPEGFRP